MSAGGRKHPHRVPVSTSRKVRSAALIAALIVTVAIAVALVEAGGVALLITGWERIQ